MDEEVVDLPPGSNDDRLGRALMHALRNAGVAVLYQDRELKTVWAPNMKAPWIAASGDEGESSILPQAQTERLNAARRNVIASGQPDRFEISVPGNEGMRWFEIWIDPDMAQDGHVQGIVTTKVENTEQKRREQTLKTLLREVSHRSKNLLEIIQSIANQTGRYSDGIADFLVRFRGRLQSLASSQDLVTSSNWRGAGLRELVLGQAARYGENNLPRLRVSGSDPFLNPNAALHIGLAMHELVVNSMSYGALSRPDGLVNVTAAMESNGDDRALIITWHEKFAAQSRDANPQRKRFGSVTLERVVPTSLNGEATLEIAGDHLDYRLVVPAGNFESD